MEYFRVDIKLFVSSTFETSRHIIELLCFDLVPILDMSTSIIFIILVLIILQSWILQTPAYLSIFNLTELYWIEVRIIGLRTLISPSDIYVIAWFQITHIFLNTVVFRRFNFMFQSSFSSLFI